MASQGASSLDAIANGRQPRSPPTPSAAAAGDDPQDSRSTSSASTPLPAEESDFYLNGNDSESSLGVPNLQDMQVTDEYECLPPVQRLPNEILICIFSKLSASSDLLNIMLTCKRWSRNAVDLLWHRPACTTWKKYEMVCNTLGREQPYYGYADFVKRLNLAQLSDQVNDGSVTPLAVCNRVERLTLTGCKGLADTGLIALATNSSHLMALDISGDQQITEESIKVIAEHCRRLQGLNISSCVRIASESLVLLAESCKLLKRLKLNDCTQITDDAVLAFAEHCPNILEIDLQQCKLVGNTPVTSLLVKGSSLRELRLANCELVDDTAFLSLPAGKSYEHLRILDLTSCVRITDRAVEKIIEAAPRLRNVVFAKCRNITDQAVFAISRLGKNLHYVHLGHCVNLTDEAVKRLVQCCNRIRYIDLGCCTHLTDESVTRLAVLPKLKRIGLVKCNNITDTSVYALAKANQRYRRPREGDSRNTAEYFSSGSSLERVHLSYCTQLTLKSIMRLLNSCPRLTHLSLTGVQAFLRQDLEQFCRDAPTEFTDHQRNVFCVFSGAGVSSLRRHLNSDVAFAHLRDATPNGQPRHAQNPLDFVYDNMQPLGGEPGPDLGFDERERDGIEDDDVLDDGSEMVVDAAPPPPPPPPPPHNNPVQAPAAGASLIPPPSQPQASSNDFQWNPQSQHWYPRQQQHPLPHSAPLPNGPTFTAQMSFASQPGGPPYPEIRAPPAYWTSGQPTASTAPVGLGGGPGPSTASMNASHSNSDTSGQPVHPGEPGEAEDEDDPSSSSPPGDLS
ncbi:hypothetical protein M406DRAFT_297121 [Cryphonectria parasitica EP155]|uniref:F-box domain-containing protein n=1 Tax=Cryphonectria parasitica (strain ATCC 38755 / EP155) TaxID=660469 RepID=A0A9P5CHV9_CRYP1|nr:uncharacterized protein M406DRAFT_297121 [Cryphonectria parasitica EP155]KAF3760354.1 hypothetical protein M406DRAFT_297121 [Cryphonectria parasitica EP155]